MKTRSIKSLTLATLALSILLTSCEKTEVSPFEDDSLRAQHHELVESNEISAPSFSSTNPIETELPKGYELRKVETSFSSAGESSKKGIQDELAEDPNFSEENVLTEVGTSESDIVRDKPQWPIHQYPTKLKAENPNTFSEAPSDNTPTAGNGTKPYPSFEKKEIIEDCKFSDCHEKIYTETARYQLIADEECRVIYFTVTCCSNGEGMVTKNLKVHPKEKCETQPVEIKPEEDR